jgi:ADP-heptose:LPS heptosyltransferase
VLPDNYVVVHPGASAPARTLSIRQWCDVVAELVALNLTPVVTGRSIEDPNGDVRRAGGDAVVDLMGRTDLPALAGVIAGARAVCVGNTGAMHLAAAVGTPTVVAHAPTVPLERWRPWRVPHRVLGDQHVACRRCHKTVCPLPIQTCLSDVTGRDVVSALGELGALEKELTG